MSEHENEDEVQEVEVHLYAEEDFTDGADIADVPSQEGFGSPAQDDIAVDFGEQAESMLEDIKSDGFYSLHAGADVEEFEPGELASDEVVNVDDIEGDAMATAELEVGDEVDELPESIEIVEEESFAVIEEEDEELAIEKAERSRRRLRNLLVFFIIILVLIAAVAGVVIWRSSTPPDVKQPDSDALHTSAAGTNVTQFQAIEADRIPDLMTYFGMTPEEAATASGGIIALDAEAAPLTDETLPAVKSTRNAWLVGDGGETTASFTFGLDEQGKICYIFATFDLDAFGVADAKFDELAASKVVAASILSGIGLDNAVVESAQLSITGNPQAVTSRDTAGKEVAEFAGTTNIEGVPSEWKVVETYDHTAGVSLGDNSVIRTLSVDLR